MVKEKEDQDIEQKDDFSDWGTLTVEEKEAWEKDKRQRQKRKAIAVKIISISLIFSLLVSGLQIWFNVFNIPAIRFLQVSKELSEDPEISEYKKSVVTIEWDGVKGTGFNVHPNGLIVTNEHVVDHTNNVIVYFSSGDSYTGEVIAKDEDYDLAVIDINADHLSILPLTFDKDWIKGIGEKIIFIGNPLSYTQIANKGTIDGEVHLHDWDIPLMMIDAPVYRGNSGSPVINKDGKVIGVVFATISSDQKNKRMGVAIPAYYLKDMIPEENR